MRTLILFAHPLLQKSHVNIHLIEGLNSIEGITFHDLYQKYPEFDIDVKREQQLLLEHDVIIFHHPFFWYSAPAIIKEWIDLVLEHDWAYGAKGNSLKGKYLFNFITAGGGAKAYCSDGYNQYTVREFLKPIEQTACLCKMTYLPPFIVFGTHSIKEEEVRDYRERYIKILKLIRDDKINFDELAGHEIMNDVTL